MASSWLYTNRSGKERDSKAKGNIIVVCDIVTVWTAIIAQVYT
jgi:hypothetical protein